MIDVKIIKELKPGGQKKVFLAEHKEYGKLIYKKGKCNSSVSLDRIKREVKILRELDSSYYPKNFYFESDAEGNFEILEELIEGVSLSECMQLFSNENTVIDFGIELIKGLMILWNKRIVHRDIKPDNIIIRNGKPVIIDLGIARDIDGTSLTKTMYLHGPCTPVYASPEQLTNNKKIIDHRSDFFSIGILLTQLIIGANPFSPDVVGNGVGIIDNILSGQFGVSYNGVALSEEYNDTRN